MPVRDGARRPSVRAGDALHRRRPGHRAPARPRLRLRWLVAASALLAAAGLLAPAAPGYDPWAWLLWGREVAGLRLDTVDGPAFKPLAVAICVLLAPLGGAAPTAWLLVARFGAVLAVLLAARVAWRLAGAGPRGVVAAAVAGVGVASCAGWWWHGAVGNAEGLFVALVLLAVDAALDDRHGRASALVWLAALLRPEVWPLLGLYGLWLWLRRPGLRPWLAGGAVLLPAAWLLPELWGSGDALRASARAQIPNPGQPATADRPAWAALRAAAEIPLVPLALAGLWALRRPRTGASPVAAWLAAGAVAWVGLVAFMAERGYAGEPRYALPGVAVLMVAAGVTVARLRWAAAAVVVVVACVPFAVARMGDVRGELGRAADDARLWDSLSVAVAAADRVDARARCGPPSTGRFRGTGVAWALDVAKRTVDADSLDGHGLVLRSRIRPGAPLMPRVPADAPVVTRSARWELRCVPHRGQTRSVAADSRVQRNGSDPGGGH